MPESSHSHTNPKRLIPLWEGRFLLIGTGLAITLCAALLLIFKPLLVEQAELRIYDLMLSGRKASPPSDLPVLVKIDEQSLKAYGQWPWPRYRLARLVEKLHNAGARVVALDFLMPEPDRTSPGIILAERRHDRQPTVPFPTTEGYDTNTQQLADAISKGRTVLGFLFNFDPSEETGIHAAPVLPEGMVVATVGASATRFPRPASLSRSVAALTDAARAEGFTNALHDRDGALRRVPLLLPYDDRYYPSLGLAALLLASGERTLTLSRESGETVLVWGKRRIPLDDAGNLLLNYRDKGKRYPSLSARSILEDSIPPEILKGRIVLVGAWARGLGDYHLVPSGRSISGLIVHATVIDNILSGDCISRPGWARGAELSALLLLGILCSWLLSRQGFWLSLLTGVAGIGISYGGARELLVAEGIYLSPFLPMLTPVAVMTFLSLLKYGIEVHKVRQRTRDLVKAQDRVIISMSALTEARDRETGGHILRTRNYVEILARQLATLPAYSQLDQNAIELLAKSAPLHDIGKVGVPDSILQKAGKLTTSEYETMKSHTLIGAEALLKTIGSSGHPESNDFLHYAQDMTAAHHERWDGSGYPYGLAGTEIPLAGRLMALADVYDALISRRVYKQGFPHAEAMEIIMRNSGKQFDPDVVDAFIARSEEFRRVAEEFSDETS